MACITTTPPTQLFPAVKAVAKTSIERIDLQVSTKDIRVCVSMLARILWWGGSLLCLGALDL
jgi:hypothetical protein